MTNKTTKVEVSKESMNKFREGIQALVPDAVSVIVDNKTLTKAEVLAKLNDGVSLFAKVEDLKLELAKATEALDVGVVDLDVFTNTLAPMVVGMFGESGATKCGIGTAKARTALSTEKRVLKKARNAATRKLRGTMGPKQKLAIRGNVPDPSQKTNNNPGQ